MLNTLECNAALNYLLMRAIATLRDPKCLELATLHLQSVPIDELAEEYSPEEVANLSSSAPQASLSRLRGFSLPTVNPVHDSIAPPFAPSFISVDAAAPKEIAIAHLLGRVPQESKM